MDQSLKNVLLECVRASDEERITFPEVVRALVAAGVERYHADLLRGERVFAMPCGGSETVAAHKVKVPVAAAFSAAGVEAAVRASQKGEIKYREFCARAAASGCAGYHVFIDGRRVLYYGRSGGFHVEHFPGGK